MARGRQSDVDVVALSLTLDVRHASLLDRVIRTGLYGRNRNEVASALVRQWLASNLKALEDQYRDLDEPARGEGGS